MSNEALQRQVNELSKQVNCLFKRLNELQPCPKPTMIQSMEAALTELNRMLQEEKVNNIELYCFENKDPARPFLFEIEASFLRSDDDNVHAANGNITFRFKEWPKLHKLCEIKDVIKNLAATIAEAHEKKLL